MLSKAVSAQSTGRLILIAIFLSCSACAQTDAAQAQTAAGCGPINAQFNVSVDETRHPMAQLEPGKGVVYVFEDETRDANVSYIGGPTTLVGVDGAWIGANHYHSYFFFSLSPGEHHICASLQSSNSKIAQVGFATDFTASADKALYFRTVVERRRERELSIKIENIDAAEGALLVSKYSLSTSHAKK